MTRKEKETLGYSKAVSLVKELQESGQLNGMTHFTIREAMSGTRWCQYTLKLYSKNRLKYKKNPLAKIDFGYRNIVNMTTADTLKALLKDTLEYGIPDDFVPHYQSVTPVDPIPF